MRSTILLAISVIVLASLPQEALGDQTVSCNSDNYQYRFCSIATHGYVRLESQRSKTRCVQGRNWDFDRRGIWVDDGCSATFVVETRHHTSGHRDHDGEKAVAAVAALALIAAASDDNDSHHYSDRYDDDDYGHGGHSSYVPRWMVGDWTGYNMDHSTQVHMHINSEGRLRAEVKGVTLQGYVNDGRAYVGNSEFFIDRAGDGFNTVEVGRSSNRVHYSRR